MNQSQVKPIRQMNTETLAFFCLNVIWPLISEEKLIITKQIRPLKTFAHYIHNCKELLINFQSRQVIPENIMSISMEGFFLFYLKAVSNDINFNLIDVHEILVSKLMIEFCPQLLITAVGLEILIWTNEQWEQLCSGLNLTIHVKYILEREARWKTSKPSWLITPAYFFPFRLFIVF